MAAEPIHEIRVWRPVRGRKPFIWFSRYQKGAETVSITKGETGRIFLG
jgi:hypothetical protein